MEAWDTIISTAMMGTDKKQISTYEVTEALAAAATTIIGNVTNDKEQRFLQLAALTLNYRKCGSLPSGKEINMQTAPAEILSYCSDAALQVLKDIISEESLPLLNFWLEHCFDKNQIVRPGLVPELLATGAAQKRLRTLITACCGRRGEWLAGFNEAWKYSSSQTKEEIWQTGTIDQRKDLVKQLRISEPAIAREWLQQTWPQEDANTKAIFLDLMTETVDDNDIIFLESLVTEKGKKVKELALQLLKLVPSSAVVRSYQHVLGEALKIKEEKSLLGMISKTTIQCKLPAAIDETIYKTGIDKLSNTKELSDDDFIVLQLIESVPPSFLETHFNLRPQQIIELFNKDATGKKLIPALVNSITRFKDSRWAISFMQHSEIFYIDMIPLLPALQQETYSNKFFDRYPDEIIRFATAREQPWGKELANNILKHASKNHYQYNRSFFNQYIALLPVTILPIADSIAPAEEYQRSAWRNLSDYIARLLQMKTSTIKAFNT
jgi:hypothetical protein